MSTPVVPDTRGARHGEATTTSLLSSRRRTIRHSEGVVRTGISPSAARSTVRATVEGPQAAATEAVSGRTGGSPDTPCTSTKEAGSTISDSPVLSCAVVDAFPVPTVFRRLGAVTVPTKQAYRVVSVGSVFTEEPTREVGLASTSTALEARRTGLGIRMYRKVGTSYSR